MQRTRYSCADVLRRLNDYLDRELADDEVRHVEEHLERCAQCAEEHAFEASLLRELKSKVRRITVPTELQERVQQLIAALDRGAEGDT